MDHDGHNAAVPGLRKSKGPSSPSRLFERSWPLGCLTISQLQHVETPVATSNIAGHSRIIR